RHDFRIIAATNRDLARLVDEGKFREDLFFRLNVFPIHLPPLRDRIDDIPTLVAYFLRRFAPDSPTVPAETIRHLQQLDWPGNVRQLRNAVQRAAILARGRALQPEHFDDSARGAEPLDGDLAGSVLRWLRARLAAEPAATNLANELLQAVEPALFHEVMRRARGNRSTAAEWLGLDRATVRKKLQAYGLEETGQTPTDS
ncbi:MAG: sigma 54-interacting transcriptional regulator, partial [Gemmataceae bacterium]|nr:sigma 54-interacting transcriptional regulator [Gemmataceae bacterium]